MFTTSPRRRWRPLLIGAALVTALAIPAVARADTTGGATIPPAWSNGLTVTVAGGPITARVLASTSVAFACDPFLVFDWETGTEVEVTTGNLEYGSVTIVQAAGRTINSGTADFSGGSVTCDGSTLNHRDVGIVAGVVPWKSGTAVAGAVVSVTSPDYESWHNGSTGPVTIKLGR